MNTGRRVMILTPCSSAPSKSAPPAAPSTNTSASSKPTAKTARSSNASSPISDARTSSRLLPKLSAAPHTATPIGEDPDDHRFGDASTWGPVLVVRASFDQLGPLGHPRPIPRARAKGVPFADRAFVLVANRLIRPGQRARPRRLARDRLRLRPQGPTLRPPLAPEADGSAVHPRQLDAWYRTLDQLITAKDQIEVALYHRLRDLFSFKPDLVLYDITSTYFEGAGPHDFAKHGYSRDGKSQNVQVIVGMVMVAGWPIAHHVWAGNRIDHSTVQEVITDLRKRFEFGRLVFVGDRGMVTDENIESLTKDGHGFLVGIKRRRNAELDGWLQKVDESKWLDCPVGITAREKKENPPRTRVQEIDLGVATKAEAEAEADAEADTETATVAPGSAEPVAPPRRVFVIDSDERRAYEQAKRTQAMERTRVKLESVRRRVADGELTDPARIGAAAERALRAHKGYRYFAWTLREGVFEFFEEPVQFEREKRLEGRYVIATTETSLERLGCGGSLQATHGSGTRLPPHERRAFHAAGVSPGGVTRTGAHFRGGAGPLAANALAAPPRRRRGRVVGGTSVASTRNGASRPLRNRRGITHRRERIQSACPPSAERPGYHQRAPAPPTDRGFDSDVMTNRFSRVDFYGVPRTLYQTWARRRPRASGPPLRIISRLPFIAFLHPLQSIESCFDGGQPFSPGHSYALRHQAIEYMAALSEQDSPAARAVVFFAIHVVGRYHALIVSDHEAETEN